MYSEAFCKIYDQFGWNYYPETFGENLMMWMKEQELHVQQHLDLGCGTGVLCEVMAKEGISTRGMDFSEEMLRVARSRADEAGLDIPYEQGDMIIYRPEGAFDLVTCTGDALNHIMELSDLGRIFENVYGYLVPGGYFIFDLLNPSEIDLDDPIDMDWEDGVTSRFLMIQDEERRIHLQVKFFKDQVMTVDEEIIEIVHDEYAVMQLLGKAGFEVCRCAHTLTDYQGGQGLTWFLIARKPLDA